MFHIKYKHLKTLQHNMDNGITEPKFGILEDNTQVIAKLFNGPEGNLILFNEYFCYRLAILLDIDMPKSGILLMDKNTEILNDNASSKNYGYGFYSSFLSKVTVLNSAIISMIGNISDFNKILLFDHVIFNSDRNPGNLLVQFYKRDISLKVIDHSHVFINQSFWDAKCLNDGITDKDYCNTKILEYNEYLYNMFYMNMSICNENLAIVSKLFQDKLSCDIMYNIIDDIPAEWLPSRNDIDALVNYLMYRVDNLDKIITTIMRYIKR